MFFAQTHISGLTTCPSIQSLYNIGGYECWEMIPLNKLVCPECGTELSVMDALDKVSIRHTCHGCGKFERIETDTPPSPGRVISEQLVLQAR